MIEVPIIETSALFKSYDGREALRGLNLRVPAGSIFGFLGRNGAGKTTTIKILLGMTKPGKGEARVFGTPPWGDAGAGIRQRIAFVSEDKDLVDGMTVAEIIRFTAAFYPGWRNDLESRYRNRFDLDGALQVKSLSRGMRTKLALLLALCRNTELLILDEPTSGLDPAVTEEVLQALVAHVANEGMTVFFSSHQMAEVEQIADSIAIIHRGRTVLSQGLDDLRENCRRIELVFDGPAPAHGFGSESVRSVKREGRVMSILTDNPSEVLDEAQALMPVSIHQAPVTLKEIFLQLTERED